MQLWVFFSCAYLTKGRFTGFCGAYVKEEVKMTNLLTHK